MASQPAEATDRPASPGRVLPRVIGIYAPSGRSGKGTVADVLMKEFGYLRLQFSTPIKQMFSTLARYAGVSEHDIARALEGDLKEVSLPALGGLSFRRFGETIGNDWGRGLNETFWLDLAIPKITRLLEDGASVVIDDLRYPNEFAVIRKWYGGSLIRVARPEENGGRGVQWQSEGRLEDMTFDANIENSGSMEDLADKVRAVVRGLAKPISFAA